MKEIIVKKFADLAVGQFATMAKTITEADVLDFARLTGDFNPIHIDDKYAFGTPLRQRIAHGALVASHVSALVGTKLPGPGTMAVSMDLKFKKPVFIGSIVSTTVEVKTIDNRRGFVWLSSESYVEGHVVIKGEVLVHFPLD